MPRTLGRILIYTALILWTIIALFPIFWTFSTTFKVAKDVQLGHIIPWVDYKPAWLGLRAIGQITAGAHLFTPGDAVKRETDQGYVTSVCWSPVFESYLGLAFLKDGRARHGQRVRLVDHMRKTDVLCEVTDPVFLDPEGAKLRA